MDFDSLVKASQVILIIVLVIQTSPTIGSWSESTSKSPVPALKKNTVSRSMATVTPQNVIASTN